MFTVFTPTFNRAPTLQVVFESLKMQTCRDFEWLIVDDGSTDGTSQMVTRWRETADFPIRYFWQENGGKHRAFNRGVEEAHGDFFLTLDSDDACVPESLERFLCHWEAIPAEERHAFSAVTALCRLESGQIVGSGLPQETIDSDPLTIRYRHRVIGEKWGFQRTEVLRRFPFPEFEGEKFVPESLVWNRIGRHYRTRYVNEPLRIYRQLADGLSNRSIQLRIASPKGTLLYYRELLEERRLTWPGRLGAAVNLLRFALHTGNTAEVARLVVGRPWVLLGFPPALALFWSDRSRR